MSNPLINVLVRTSYRPTTFARCIASVQNQTYKNIRVIVSYDDDRALEYIPDWCEKLPVTKSTEPFGYNLYCNDLKAQVKEGWFFFLDDDDRLADESVLWQLVGCIEYHEEKRHLGAILTRFIRGAIIKPFRKEIVLGKIGMPCIVSPYWMTQLLNFQAREDADFYYIDEINDLYGCEHYDIILVRASRRGRGYIEEMAS